jgi:hypothetical protein
MIFVLIIIAIILYIYVSRNNEQFIEEIVVGYNHINVPLNKIPTAYDNETRELTDIFSRLFKDEDNNFDLATYNLYSDYIEFPFNNIIKKMIADYIKNVGVFNKDKIEINADINRLYWKNDGNNRLFIFNVNLLNNTRFMTRNIQVKIMIKNINNFTNGNDYRTDVPSATLTSSTDMLYIKLDTDNYFSKIKDNYTGIDKLEPNYYNIKNTLFLMDPFLTSGNNMILTNDMKTNFQTQIASHEELMKSMSQ